MNRWITGAALCGLAACTSPLSAQTWPLEPDAVLGIRLGASLESSIPKCPSALVQQPTTLCFYAPYGGRRDVELRGLPSFAGVFYEGSVALHDGIVESVQLTFAQRDFGTMRRLLEERYGPPTKTHAEQFVNRAGATAPSVGLDWKGTSVAIYAFERATRIDQSSVGFISLPTKQKRMQAVDKAAKQDASKL